MLSVYSFLPNVGIPELLIVLAVAILILGPRRIPAAIRSIGGGLRGFKEEIGSGKSEAAEAPYPTKAPPPSQSETKT